MNHPMQWKPYTVEDLSEIFGKFDNWFLVGGESIDLYLGKKTRDHGDIDIGVLSTHAPILFSSLQSRGLQIYSAQNGELTEYTDTDLKTGLSNFWVSDEFSYKMQILVYPVCAGKIPFKRNPALAWDIDTFIISVNGIKILNPLVTYAFKLTTNPMLEKDVVDIVNLTNMIGSARTHDLVPQREAEDCQ